ncbi:hypothetical protein ACFX2F_028118 [Malus domestica]
MVVKVLKGCSSVGLKSQSINRVQVCSKPSTTTTCYVSLSLRIQIKRQSQIYQIKPFPNSQNTPTAPPILPPHHQTISVILVITQVLFRPPKIPPPFYYV